MRISTLQFDSLSLTAMRNSQRDLQSVQSKLTSGEKIINISEDPVGSTRVHSLETYNKQLATLTENNEIATNKLRTSEETLNSINTITLRIQELKSQASTPTLNNTDRAIIATEMEERLNEMLALANTRDLNGDYIYSGFSSNSQAYIKTQANDFVYQGDTGRRMLDVGISASIALNDTGFDLFENIPTGNGFFEISDGPTANTGSGTLSGGEVVDFGAYVRETYTIDFVTNSNGNLAFTVTGSTSGQIAPALPAVIPAAAPDYSPSATISFNGVNLNIHGEPQAGDDFTLQPSTTQNVFKSVQNMVDALRQGINNDADFAQYLNTMDANSLSLNQGFERNIEAVADLGARINVIESETESLADFTLLNQTTISKFADYDVTEGTILLSQLTTQLEVAQQVFVRLSQLSLISLVAR